MSALDIDIGRFALEEVNRLRSHNGRWPLQEDSRLSEWAWNHIDWMLWHGGGFHHPQNGELHFQVENIFDGDCRDPYTLAWTFIHHGDAGHFWNFIREDIYAQGVAVFTQQYWDKYWMVLTWRALKQG